MVLDREPITKQVGQVGKFKSLIIFVVPSQQKMIPTANKNDLMEEAWNL